MTVSQLGVGPDPDATPTATTWQEYLAAAQSLDAVVRESTAAQAAAARTVEAARAELATVQAGLEQQRARIVAAAARAGLPAPVLLPTPAEQAEAYAQVAAVPAVADVVRPAQHLLAQADAQLAAMPPPARWRSSVWLVVVAPTAAAIVLVCALGLLILLTR